eukprot:6681019-Alexandrium_andersonii.AAC.1
MEAHLVVYLGSQTPIILSVSTTYVANRSCGARTGSLGSLGVLRALGEIIQRGSPNSPEGSLQEG